MVLMAMFSINTRQFKRNRPIQICFGAYKMSPYKNEFQYQHRKIYNLLNLLIKTIINMDINYSFVAYLHQNVGVHSVNSVLQRQ